MQKQNSDVEMIDTTTPSKQEQQPNLAQPQGEPGDL